MNRRKSVNSLFSPFRFFKKPSLRSNTPEPDIQHSKSLDLSSSESDNINDICESEPPEIMSPIAWEHRRSRTRKTYIEPIILEEPAPIFSDIFCPVERELPVIKKHPRSSNSLPDSIITKALELELSIIVPEIEKETAQSLPDLHNLSPNTVAKHHYFSPRLKSKKFNSSDSLVLDQLKKDSDTYVYGDVLGMGGNAVVKKATKTGTGQVFAAKIFKQKDVTQIDFEIMISKIVSDSVFFPTLYDVFIDSCARINIISEYCSGGNLLTLNDPDFRNNIEKNREDFRQIISGVQYLHNKRIVHLDLKPGNILYGSDGIIKIIDFGLAQIIPRGTTHILNYHGTPSFNSPELCDPQKKAHLGQPIDIWALGITLYCMVFNKMPFTGPVLSIFDQIVNRELDFTSLPDAELRDLFYGLLRKNPEERLNIDQVLQHDWVKNN